MPVITHSVSTPIHETFRAHQIAGLFDLELGEQSRASFSVEVPPLADDWTIGAIVGPSGSGKSTIARAAFGDAVIDNIAWPRESAVLDGFDEGLTTKQIARTLSAVGFSSPLAWLRPYHVLSNGERFRCDLARALLSRRDVVVCDEFTSVIDRTVAKVASAAIAKTVRKQRSLAQRFVAVTCHYDVLDWLECDWVLDMASSTLTWGRLQRPRIELCVQNAKQAEWRRFARHHYLSGSLSRGATCYIASWHGEPVAFCAVIRTLGRRDHKRITRLVTLPDYQGLGIGTRLLEHVAERVIESGERCGITTSHPAMCAYLHASQRWICTRVRRGLSSYRQVFRDAPVRDSRGRVVTSFEFLG